MESCFRSCARCLVLFVTTTLSAQVATLPGFAVLGLDMDASGTTLALGGSDLVEIYERDALTSWRRTAVIDWPTGAQFGVALALDGDTLAVGAPFEAIRGRENGTSLDLVGTTLVVGTKPVPAFQGGGVYVFERDVPAGSWNLCEIVSSPGWRSYDDFGTVASLSGTTLLVGARDSSSFGPRSGAAYVFERSP